MSPPIRVNAYSRYKANEHPRELVLDDEYYEIVEIEDRLVRTRSDVFQGPLPSGKRYILRYNEAADEWTLESVFIADELLSRPNIHLVTVDADVVRRAEKMIIAREHCHPGDAEIPFDWVLDKVTGQRGTSADYMMIEPARCPTYKLEVTEKTLVDLRDE